LIRNIHRVLRPGGVCYFAGPNLLWPIEPHVFWPFVHWLPRRSAHALMRWFGSKRYPQLDAYSTTHWTLQRWFEESGFEVVNLLRLRLLAALDVHQRDGARLIASAIPDGVYQELTPISPGLVYLLVKPRDDRSTLA
jgi:SAM-dependent methyltransferase